MTPINQPAPTWMKVVGIIGLLWNLLGCILLLMRKNLAVPVFALSLAGVIVQNIHSYMLANALEMFGTGALIQSTLVVTIATCLFWVALKAKREGWSS